MRARGLHVSDAGWFPDPTGRFQQRYWDGDRWSEHVANGTRRATDPLEVAAPAPTGPARPSSSSRRTLVIFGALAVAAVAAYVALGAADDGPWSGGGSSLAQRACGNARAALEEFSRAERSAPSTIQALEDASDDAHSAVVLDAKWRPLSRSIVGARNELAHGEPGTHTVALMTNCGMPDP